MTTYSSTFIERFWAKVDIRGPDDCWPWTASRDRSGTGRVKPEHSRTCKTATVIAYIIEHGTLPDGFIAQISCGNRGCCNPKHIKLRRRRRRDSYTELCKYCGAPLTFDQRYGSHCSAKCARNAYLERIGYTRSERVPAFEKRERILREMPFEELGETHKREVVLREQAGRCGECDLHEWLDGPIPLELEHKDGIRENWVRSNLVLLCPNCHALTTTWRGRRLKGRTQHKREVNGMSLRQILKKAGLTPKARNYDILKKRLGGEDLPLFANREKPG